MNRFLPVLFFVVATAAASWAETEPDATAIASEATQTQVDARTRRQAVRAAKTGASKRNQKESTEAKVRDLVRKALAGELDDSGTINLNIGGGAGGEENVGFGEALVAIIAILITCGSPIMLVIAILYARHRKRRLALDMANQFLSNGKEVPPEVWQGLAGDASPRSNLHKGMLMLGLGAGVFLCFWLIGFMTAAYVGLIPLFVGLAQLLIWKLETPKG